MDEARELGWRDYRGPLVSQFFRGSHWWVLEPLPNGHTRFLHGAEMHGLLLPLIQPTMHAIRRGYTVWNKALRHKVLHRMQQEKAAAAAAGPAQGAASTQQQQQEGEAQPAHKNVRTRLQAKLQQVAVSAVSAVAKVQRKKSKRQAGVRKAGAVGAAAAADCVGGDAAAHTGVTV